jgi:lysophospholipase L1-like esterase
VLGVSAVLVTLSCSVAVAVLLGEVVVRIAKPGFPGFRVPQVEHRPERGLGFEMVPGQTAFSTASPVRINAAGFRGDEVREHGNAGRPRVLALGDSMTFGVSVGDDDTYPEQLERLLARRVAGSTPEVINAGVQRYFAFQEIDLLRAHVQTLRPDIVTLALYINDLGVRPTGDFVREYENEREQAATAFRRRFPRTYLVIKNSALVELAKNTYLMLSRSRRSRPTIVQDALDGRVHPRDELKWHGVEQELLAFSELARTHQFQPVVVFVPVRQQVQEDRPASVYPHRLAEYATRIGLPAIDLTDLFTQSLRAGDDPFLPWDDHMSVTGHRLAAEAIAEELERHATTARGRDLQSSHR